MDSIYCFIVAFKYYIEWSVGFSAGAVWTNGGANFGRKQGWFWAWREGGFNECQEGLTTIRNGVITNLGRNSNS